MASQDANELSSLLRSLQGFLPSDIDLTKKFQTWRDAMALTLSSNEQLSGMFDGSIPRPKSLIGSGKPNKKIRAREKRIKRWDGFNRIAHLLVSFSIKSSSTAREIVKKFPGDGVNAFSALEAHFFQKSQINKLIVFQDLSRCSQGDHIEKSVDVFATDLITLYDQVVGLGFNLSDLKSALFLAGLDKSVYGPFVTSVNLSGLVKDFDQLVSDARAFESALLNGNRHQVESAHVASHRSSSDNSGTQAFTFSKSELQQLIHDTATSAVDSYVSQNGPPSHPTQVPCGVLWCSYCKRDTDHVIANCSAAAAASALKRSAVAAGGSNDNAQPKRGRHNR